MINLNRLLDKPGFSNDFLDSISRKRIANPRETVQMLVYNLNHYNFGDLAAGRLIFSLFKHGNFIVEGDRINLKGQITRSQNLGEYLSNYNPEDLERYCFLEITRSVFYLCRGELSDGNRLIDEETGRYITDPERLSQIWIYYRPEDSSIVENYFKTNQLDFLITHLQHLSDLVDKGL